MNSFRNLISTVCLSMALWAGAQAPVVSFRISGGPSDTPLSLAMRPIGNGDERATLNFPPPSAEGVYSTPVVAAPSGLYYIYAYNVKGTFQSQTPIYIPASDMVPGKVIDLAVEDSIFLHCNIDDAANRNIFACAKTFVRVASSISDWAVTADSLQILNNMRSIINVADSALKASPVTPAAEEFIRLWAYSTASDAFRMVVHLRHNADLPTPVNSSSFLPDPSTVLDNELAATFGTTTPNILRTLRGSVPERMAKLHEQYKCKTIINKVSDALLESYVRTYNYDNGVQPGLDMLADLHKRYGISERWAKQLRLQRSTSPGSPFPDVKLVDTQGNEVPFSNFLGKWIYIDLWASWCGPCLQQIPYLKKLEKTLADAPIHFLSISVDSDKGAWLKKVKDLDLHGNQLHDSSGTLTKALNISGIPHFLLYSPDGKLHTYKCTRPSQPETIKMLRSLK